MLWFFLVCVSSRQLKHKQSNFTCCQGKSQRKVLRRDSNTVQTRYEVKLSTNPNRTKCPRLHPHPAKPPYQKPGRRRFAMCSNHPDTVRTTQAQWSVYSIDSSPAGASGNSFFNGQVLPCTRGLCSSTVTIISCLYTVALFLLLSHFRWWMQCPQGMTCTDDKVK